MVNDQHVNPGSGYAREVIPVAIPTAVSQSNANAIVFRPGYRFTVEKVESFARTVTATVTFDVLVGTNVIVDDVVPVANTRTEHAFAAAFATTAARRGAATDDVTVRFTTNGTGALVNGVVVLYIRPFPAGGEVG